MGAKAVGWRAAINGQCVKSINQIHWPFAQSQLFYRFYDCLPTKSSDRPVMIRRPLTCGFGGQLFNSVLSAHPTGDRAITNLSLNWLSERAW